MKKRKHPFGYEMLQGKIVIKDEEAALVREIFDCYLKGYSYRQLTLHMNAQSIPYLQPEKLWNKNMIARILQNGKYIGDGSYPQIIEKTLFLQAQEITPKTVSVDQDRKQIRLLQKKVVCAVCGHPMTKNKKNNWSCPECRTASVKMSDKAFSEAVRTLLRRLAEEPEAIETPLCSFNPHPELEKKLEEAMLQVNDNEHAAIDAALALANAQLSDIGSEGYQGMYIRQLLETQDTDIIPISTIRQITKEILLCQDASIILKLKNNQTVRRRKCDESHIT